MHCLETWEQMFTSQVIYLGIDDQSDMSEPEGMSGTDKPLLCYLDLQGFKLHINVGSFSLRKNKQKIKQTYACLIMY